MLEEASIQVTIYKPRSACHEESLLRLYLDTTAGLQRKSFAPLYNMLWKRIMSFQREIPNLGKIRLCWLRCEMVQTAHAAPQHRDHCWKETLNHANTVPTSAPKWGKIGTQVYLAQSCRIRKRRVLSSSKRFEAFKTAARARVTVQLNSCGGCQPLAPPGDIHECDLASR